jgi:hypothetical protein
MALAFTIPILGDSFCSSDLTGAREKPDPNRGQNVPAEMPATAVWMSFFGLVGE